MRRRFAILIAAFTALRVYLFVLSSLTASLFALLSGCRLSLVLAICSIILKVT